MIFSSVRFSFENVKKNFLIIRSKSKDKFRKGTIKLKNNIFLKKRKRIIPQQIVLNPSHIILQQ